MIKKDQKKQTQAKLKSQSSQKQQTHITSHITSNIIKSISFLFTRNIFKN